MLLPGLPSNDRALSSRIRVIKDLGDSPALALSLRCKVRSLTASDLASLIAVNPRPAARTACSASSKKGVACSIKRRGANTACVSGVLSITAKFAVSIATSGPSSWLMVYSPKSIHDMGPPMLTMRLSSTRPDAHTARDLGKRCINSSCSHQVVVQRLPLSSPASPSTNTPAHEAPSMAPWACCFRSHGPACSMLRSRAVRPFASATKPGNSTASSTGKSCKPASTGRLRPLPSSRGLPSMLTTKVLISGAAGVIGAWVGWALA